MPTVAIPRKPVKPRPLPPVPADGHFPGGATWQELLAGTAVLQIDRPEDTNDWYWCGYVVDSGEVRGYNLVKFGTGATYFFPADCSGCDCPDRTYRPERPGGCKHMRGLAQALAARRAPDRKTERDEITPSEAA
jgi:hypothetical protein